MINYLKSLLTHPHIEKLIREELYEAERGLLTSESALDWALANVEYNRARLARLQKRMKEIQMKQESIVKKDPPQTVIEK